MKIPSWLIVVLVSLLACAVARAQGWPDVFSPMQVLNLNLELSDTDWQTVQNDDTLSIEVPAQFWADGEVPITVSVRRKSAQPVQNGTPFKKVALKIDINQFQAGLVWRGLNKLSLETGADENPISEGLAWHLNRMASGPEGYNYEHPAAMGAWVRMNINGHYTGLYLSVEQRDTRFLRNRGLYIPGETWLYDIKSEGQMTIDVGSGDSPTVTQLCYRPFEPGVGGECSTPSQATIIAQLDQLVDVRGMLTMGAIDAFCGNPDAIFSHGKNFTYADFASGRKRMYFPWDLDAVLGGNANSFYVTSSGYGSLMLGIPQYRQLYSQIMNDLLCGPLSEANVVAFIDAIEPVLTPHLAQDPNSEIDGSIADFFDNRRAWMVNRIANVRSQIEGYVPCPPPPPPCGSADFDCDGDVGTDADIESFFACLAGNCPPAAPGCTSTADFNADGDVGTDADIEAFFRVLSGGTC
jgi:hypothetical protein